MPEPAGLPQSFQSGRFTGLQGGATVYRPPEEHLVAGRLRELQSRNNPLVQRARSMALRRANARGDVNSSYAAGAAENAAFDAMLPVAQQDSDTLTRVHMQNAQNEQDRAIAEANANAAQGSYAVGQAMAAAERDNAEAARNLQLQLQRERLAYEGEQAGYGRSHDVDMFQRALGRDLTVGEQQFLQQMALGQQGFGFTRQLQEDAYGHDIGRMGFDWQMQRDLGNQQGDWASRLAQQQFQYGNQRWQQDLYSNFMNTVINNPDMFGDPQAVDGMMQFFFGSEPGSAPASFFQSVFGR